MTFLVPWLLLVIVGGAPPASGSDTLPASPTSPARQAAAAPPIATAAVPQAPGDDAMPIKIGPLRLGGFLQGDGVFGVGDYDHTTLRLDLDSFCVRRARLAVGGDVTPEIAWTVQADVVHSPVLTDAYITLHHFRRANVRVGQFVAPYSLERLTSESRNEAYERVIDRFGPSRDVGIMVFSPTPVWKGVSYAAAIINGTGQNVRDDNVAKDYVGRLTWQVPGVPGVKVGANAQSGTQPTGRRTRVGADVAIEEGSYHLAAEWLRETRDECKEGACEGYYVLATRRFRPAAPRPSFYMVELVGRVFALRDPFDPLLGPPGTTHREWEVGVNYYFARSAKVAVHLLTPIARRPGETAAVLAARLQVIF
jgi:phosphate-selective porin